MGLEKGRRPAEEGAEQGRWAEAKGAKLAGDCHYCGKPGHRIRNCRLKTKHVGAGIFKKTAFPFEEGSGEEDLDPVWLCTLSDGTCTTGQFHASWIMTRDAAVL